MMSIAGLSLSAMFTGCSSGRDAEDMTNVVYNEEGKAGVKPEFVLSLPRKVVGGTRMEGGIVQYLGTSDQFRGIDNIRLIPFSDAQGLCRSVRARRNQEFPVLWKGRR